MGGVGRLFKFLMIEVGTDLCEADFNVLMAASVKIL